MIIEYPRGFTALLVPPRSLCRSNAGWPPSFCGSKGTLTVSRSGFVLTGDRKIPPEDAVPQFAGALSRPGGPQRGPAKPGELWADPSKTRRATRATSSVARSPFTTVASAAGPGVSIWKWPSGGNVITWPTFPSNLAGVSAGIASARCRRRRRANKPPSRPYRAPWDKELKVLEWGDPVQYTPGKCRPSDVEVCCGSGSWRTEPARGPPRAGIGVVIHSCVPPIRPGRTGFADLLTFLDYCRTLGAPAARKRVWACATTHPRPARRPCCRAANVRQASSAPSTKATRPDLRTEITPPGAADAHRFPHRPDEWPAARSIRQRGGFTKFLEQAKHSLALARPVGDRRSVGGGESQGFTGGVNRQFGGFSSALTWATTSPHRSRRWRQWSC